MEHFNTLAERLDAVPGIAALEVNISCPNQACGGIEFGVDPELTRQVIASVKARTTRLRTVSAKVQVGGNESSDFETKYVLPKRVAYGTVIAEIERMAKSSGLHERDAVYSEEPIEGSADLNLLNSTANYEGTYDNLKKFLYEVDHSPMLIMLENITAAPQQKGNEINTSIRFQAVIREDGVPVTRGQQ